MKLLTIAYVGIIIIRLQHCCSYVSLETGMQVGRRSQPLPVYMGEEGE